MLTAVLPTTKCILSVGANLPESNVYVWPATNLAIENGAKLINVDPRYTEMVRHSELWLRLRPGTDAALLLAMLNVIVEERLYDEEFVEKWAYGFDKLKERLKEFTPEKAAEICWVPPEKIREAARLYATTKPSVAPWSYALEPQTNSFSNNCAKLLLPVITGNIDTEAGNYIAQEPKYHGESSYEDSDLLSAEQRKKHLPSRFKLVYFPAWEAVNEYASKKGYYKGTKFGPGLQANQTCIMTPDVYNATLEGKPYPVRAWILAEGSIHNAPNIERGYKAMKSLDLSVVVETATMTPWAMLADYVLPATSFYERPHMMTGYGSVDSILAVGERALPKTIHGISDRRDDFDVFRELAHRMIPKKQFEERYPYKSLEEFFADQIKPLGITMDELIRDKAWFPENEFKKYEMPDPDTGQPRGFGTKTGKIEIYMTMAERFGYDPLPHYIEPAESPISTPEEAKDYPLILTTGGRHHEMQHAELFHISLARQLHPDPLVHIHPLTARNLGIGDGNWVWIETPTGKCKMKARWSEAADPKIISAEHGWWFPELPAEEPTLYGYNHSNIDACVDDDANKCCKETGTYNLKAMMCKIYRAY